MEIWKKIIGFENYEVSNLGNVKNTNFKRTGKEQILKSTKNSSGYLLLSLFKNGNRNRFQVHYLVAVSFIDNPENKKCINHIDGNKLNNKLENLEWNTHSENTKHAFKIGLMKNNFGESQHLSKLKENDVLEIRKNKEHLTYREMAKKYKVSVFAIHSVIKRKTWKHI